MADRPASSVAVGLLLGLALASKWVGAYAIGGVGLLILLRSSLGRWIALAAMIALTGVLGYIAITPNPTVQNPQINYLFLGIMIVLTLLLAVGITVRPMRLTRDEFRFAVALPLLLGVIAVVYGAYRLIAGPPAAAGALLPPTRILALGVAGIAIGVAVAGVGWYLGRRGRGPLASADDRRSRDAPSWPRRRPSAAGCVLDRASSGCRGCSPCVAITAIPLVVYVISYIPWINLGNQWFTGLSRRATPARPSSTCRSRCTTTTTTCARRTRRRRRGGRGRSTSSRSGSSRATTPAARPRVIYDTGNIVAVLAGHPGRGLGVLAGVEAAQPGARLRGASPIMCMWLPWARIDRATFQYHVFTMLPFSFMALAYFIGRAVARTRRRGRGGWRRSSAGLAIIGAPLLWLFRAAAVRPCQHPTGQQGQRGVRRCCRATSS